MAEISLKCEVPGCSFLTPRLLPRFYGEMVEHLKVHHLSCHGDNGPRSVSANSTPAARMDRIKIADGEEAKKILDLNMNTKSAGNIFVCSEPGCLFKTEYQSNMVRHKKNKHFHKEQNGESYKQMTSCVERIRKEEVEGSRRDRPANKMIKLHRIDAKHMEEETGDSWRVNNCAGAMSKDEAYVEKETAAVELEMEGREGGKMKWTLGGVLCPNCQIKFRSVSELTIHKQTCIRRTSNTTRPKKKREHDSDSSDVESEYEDDENVATCQGCEMSFASVAGLDAHRQRCNMKVRCDVNKLKGEVEVEGNNNFKQGVCEDSKPPLEVSDRLMSTKSEDIEKIDVVGYIAGEKFVGSGTTQWNSMSKEVACSSLPQDAVNNTGELSERGKGDTLGHAGHPQLDVNFSKSKSANAQNAAKEANLENKSDASPMLEKRAEVSGGGSWSDFIAENGACPSSGTPLRRRRTTTPRIPQGPETPQNEAKGGAETKAKMLVDFLSKEGKPFRINLTLPRDCNMHRVLAKIADNFKTDIDQLSLSRKGIELTGEERAEDFEGEIVVVRPRMAQ